MTFSEIFQNASTLILAVLTGGGGGAVIAYKLFQNYGSGWLDQRFKKQLEEFKHEQQKELERLRSEINSEFSRVSKIHQVEFEVLPEAWRRLKVAQGWAGRPFSFNPHIPDFSTLSEEEFEEFLKHCPLRDSQKNALRSAEISQRGARYEKDWERHELDQFNEANIELQNYLMLKSIFMTKELRASFLETNNVLRTLFDMRRSEFWGHLDNEGWQRRESMWNETKLKLESIEAAIQDRLHYYKA